MIRGCLKSLELVEFYAKRLTMTWLILDQNYVPDDISLF
jgi:hypothetical protein